MSLAVLRKTTNLVGREHGTFSVSMNNSFIEPEPFPNVLPASCSIEPETPQTSKAHVERAANDQLPLEEIELNGGLIPRSREISA